jgi:regulator of PEP synthase PpsR (kinase-PPPase family)
LEKVDRAKVVALITTPERLAEVRQARLSRLNTIDSSYADVKRIAEELDYCRTLVGNHPGWHAVDVTGKSVEEIAAEILDSMYGKERRL